MDRDNSRLVWFYSKSVFIRVHLWLALIFL